MGATEFLLNPARKEHGAGVSLAIFNPEEAALVHGFLKSFTEYTPTPLVPMPHLAKEFGLRLVMVKDESRRFGLNAFKVLGGAWAMGRYLAERLGLPLKGLTVEGLHAAMAKAGLTDITFATATDGNHGRGVAWTAAKLGCKAKVFMPKGSAEIRAANIRATGADCVITDKNYDDTVRMVAAEAAKNGWAVVQDTAWEGYEDIPRWIMQGYMTLAVESLEQMQAHTLAAGLKGPTHLFLQAGVGSFAGAALGFFAAALGQDCPTTIIVEPNAADCIFRSIKANDGKPHAVSGDMPTIMAGLACGEPSTISWEVLRDYAAAAISCPDAIAANGMRILAAPGGGDIPVVSGESGAVTCGMLEYIMCHPDGAAMRKALNLTPESAVLLISTEGDTDPAIYREVVWHGKYGTE